MCIRIYLSVLQFNVLSQCLFTCFYNVYIFAYLSVSFNFIIMFRVNYVCFFHYLFCWKTIIKVSDCLLPPSERHVLRLRRRCILDWISVLYILYIQSPLQPFMLTYIHLYNLMFDVLSPLQPCMWTYYHPYNLACSLALIPTIFQVSQSFLQPLELIYAIAFVFPFDLWSFLQPFLMTTPSCHICIVFM